MQESNKEMLQDFKKKLRLTGSNTIERPHVLEADVIARYTYAQKFCKNKSVLDIGTGFGMGAEFLANHEAKNVMGIDYDEAAILQASQLSSKNLTFKTMNALELEKMKEKFDIILAFEIIEHLPLNRVNDFIKILSQHLNDSGILLITTPNGKFTKFFWGKPYNPYHIKEYTQEELMTFVKPFFPSVRIKGFTCVDRKYSQRQKNIENKLLYKVIYFVGHFKIVRELLAYIPKTLKQFVTQESTLPSVTVKNYRLLSNYETEGLFLIAQKKDELLQNNPIISIIIANYNGEKYLPTLLNSISKNTLNDYETVICDDGSKDKSELIIRKYMKKDSRIRFCKNRKNMGAAASRNIARMYARGKYLVFLDNDTEIDKNFLKEMLATMQKNPTIGGCQAKVLDFKDRNKIQTAGCLLWAGTGWGLPRGQWQIDSGQFNEEVPIIASSVALMIKTKVFDEVGGFDIEEAIFTEDIDFSWRVWINGHKIIFSPKSIVYHWTKNISMRKNMKHSMEIVYFHLTKNSLISICKNYQIFNTYKYFSYAVVVILGRGGLVLIKRNDFSALLGTYKGFIWFLKNIYSTFKKRLYIQHTRKYTDNYLLHLIMINKNPISMYKEYYRASNLLEA